jgi:hypothetical protein
MLAREFCWRLPVAERLQVPAFFGSTTVQERGVNQGIQDVVATMRQR